MEVTITNIFSSEQTFSSGIPVVLYSMDGVLEVEMGEKVASWFSHQFKIPATATMFNGNLCLIVATDGRLPDVIEYLQDNVKLNKIGNFHTLKFGNEQDRSVIGKLVYRSMEHHLKDNYKSDFWLRSKSNRRYCEREPAVLDKGSGVQIFSCFSVFNEILNKDSIGLVLDTSSTLVETKTLFDQYKSMRSQDFNSKYSNSWVLLTDEYGEKRPVYFVGAKQGFNIDSQLISAFRSGDDHISVRDRYHNRNTITNERFLNDEPVAETRVYKDYDKSVYVPLSCLQYFPSFEEIKEENDDIRFSDEVYLTPGEKYRRILKYLEYFQNMEIGSYKKPIRLNFSPNPVIASGEIELPPLKFGNSNVVVQEKNFEKNKLKFLKLNSLSESGYYKKSDIEKILILHRKSFDKGKVIKFMERLLRTFADYSLDFSDSNVEIVSNLDNVRDLKAVLDNIDPEVLYGALAIVDDRYFDYKTVKEMLNSAQIPSQAIKEETLRNLNPDKRRYQSVIQNVVAGIVTKGDGIPWILANELSCSLFVGIDSGGQENEKSWASAYVFDEYGEKVHFTEPKYYAKEGIPTDDFKKLILEAVEKKLIGDTFGSKLKGIAIHRDGFLTKTERKGLETALNILKVNDDIAHDFRCIAVDVKKDSNFRLFRSDGKKVGNPRMGSYFLLDKRRGFISTTGEPLLSEPTSKPLLAEIDSIMGDFDPVEVLRDVFFLSELNWGSPAAEIKLPITTYYADKMIDFADYISKPTYLPI